jgi:enterochelin esterase-like enzyme
MGMFLLRGTAAGDPPKFAANTGLSFQLKQFDSQAWERGIYGVILPPGYAEHLQQRYPVIILLHGGHDDARAYFDKYGITDVLHHLYQHRNCRPRSSSRPMAMTSGDQAHSLTQSTTTARTVR